MNKLSPRTIRRAAMRQTAKIVAKTISQLTTNNASAAACEASEEPTVPPVPRRLSPEQLAANRANSLKSTGPTSSAGKAKVSFNAVRTAMCGRIVLLPTDDAAIYQAHLDRHFAEFAPVDAKEKTLVQFIADAEWRLLRIMPWEASVLAVARENCAHLVEDETDPIKREAVLQGHVFLAYRKDLNNISLQERRLRNQLKQDIAELQALQAERVQKEKQRAIARLGEIDRAERLLADAKKSNIPVNDLREFGFDFSIAEMAAYHKKNVVYHTLTRGRSINFDEFLTKFRAENRQTEAQAA